MIGSYKKRYSDQLVDDMVEQLMEEYMDDDEIIDQALKYTCEEEFKIYSSNAYSVARSRGKEYLDEVCKHMKRIPVNHAVSGWDEDEIIAEANKYKTRADFAKHSHSAYQAARRYGTEFLDKACKHMKPISRGRQLAKAAHKFATQEMAIKHRHMTAQKVIPKRKKIDLIEFLQETDVEYIEAGKYSEKIKDYIFKNNKQVKQINKAQSNFVNVMGDKMCSSELTFVRFKAIVDTAVKAMEDKNTQNLEILKTLVVMDESNFSDDAIYEKNFKLLDDNFLENEKNVSVVFDISLKLSQMKNKNSTVEHSYAIDELDSLQKNIEQYIK